MSDRPRYAVLSTLVVASLGSLFLAACGDDDGAGGADTPAARFCEGLSSSVADCATPGMCLSALVDDCASFAGVVNEAFLEAGATCVGAMEPLDVCLAAAIGEAEPTDAHRAFASAFCAECALGISGCEEQFFGGSGDVAIAGNVILPFGDAAVDALRTECATGFGCAASFPSCAQRVLIEQGIPQQTIECVVSQLTGSGSRDAFRGCLPSLPDGGAIDAGAPVDAGGSGTDGGVPDLDGGSPADAGTTDGGPMCAASETCGNGRDDDCNGIADDGCATGYHRTSESHELGSYGGGAFSGPPFSLACAPDEVVVGLAGRSGDRVDQVSPSCARLLADGTFDRGTVTTPGSAGGTGGTFFEDVCPGDGDVVVGLHGRSGSRVDALGVTCADVSEWVSGTAASFDLAFHGGTGGSAFRAMCARGSVLTGIHGLAGSRVDEISGTCHRITP